MKSREISRRAFVRDLGRGGLAVAVLGLTALSCSDDESSGETTVAPTSQPAVAPSTTEGLLAPVTWERVNLGFVSAYVLARGGEAAIVDTGVAGSEAAIEASLTALNLGWNDVGHVIVTHLHNDHQGSLPAVLDLAPDATAYAGQEDIPEIQSPRRITAVGDGDTVFDLTIIETPGHTPGHISVLDPAGTGLLVAGDALNGQDGEVIGANPQFTSDIPTADDSVRRLGQFTYDTVVFGHGEPVVGLASQQVATLGASL